MKVNFKIISCICLFVYIIFGLLNTGGVGFCLGNEHSRHFGINFLGYESCCKTENVTLPLKDSIVTINHKFPSINSHCNCNDEFIQTSTVSQNTSANISLDGLFHSIDIIGTQLVVYYINFDNIQTSKLTTQHRIRDNCISILNTVVLTI